MNSSRSRNTPWAAVVAFALCLPLAFIFSNPPAPVEDEPADRFSAISAATVLESIYADGVTHPIGTNNNREYKERILDHLRQLGYEPTVQRAFACRESGVCGHVENILARLEGTDPGKSVLLAVHYDSVGAGPSVSDDGVAVAATLEIARMLKAGPRLRNDVIFLVDEGEEAGLLGAIAFAAEHPWADDVGAVVNLEARGTAGRSYMFETGVDNAWLIDLMKRHVPRPATHSLFFSIYQRLPVDTDFTVFKKHGMNGVNFAFIRDVAHYHTPLDNLKHLSLATLQHQGENALGMVRALADTDLVSPPAGTASWFDVWGFGIVSWPEPWNLPLAILSLFMITAASGIHLAKGRVRGSEILWGQILFPTAILGATVFAAAIGWFLTSVGKVPAWPASAWAPKTAFWLIGVITPALVIAWMGRRAGATSAWLGALEWLGLLALICSILLPGATYLFLVPALVGGSLAVVGAIWGGVRLRSFGTFLTIVAICTAQLILTWSLWEAMGIKVMPVVSFLVAGMVTLVMIPFVDWRQSSRSRFSFFRVAVVGLALVSLLAGMSVVLPAYSTESPRRLNFSFVQDAENQTARLVLRQGKRPLPESLAAVVDWRADLEHFYPWWEGTPEHTAADVDPLPVSPPALEILEQEKTPGGRRIVARFFSPRRADRAALVFHDPDRITSLRLDGWAFDLTSGAVWRRGDDWRMVSSATIPNEGIEVELQISGTEPIDMDLVDYSYGLPPAGDILLGARPENVVPSDRGDLTVVHASTSI